MKLLLTNLFLAITLSSTVFADDFSDIAVAFHKGDYKTAMKLMKPLAEQGDAGAQYSLGLMYDEGRGVPKNNQQAVKWYRLAAEQGHASAQYALGFMYANGEGVPEDKVLAYMWWNLAAANGHENASTGKDIITKRMTSSQIAEAQKLSRDCLKNNYKNC